MANKVMRNDSLVMGQPKADLQAVHQLLNAIEEKQGNEKFLRGLAGFHLQQAVEKLIKIQIYVQVKEVDYHRIYDHHIERLINYGEKMGASLDIPGEIRAEALTITAWEAYGRYDLHSVIRVPTIRKYLTLISSWYDRMYRDGYR